MLAVLNHDRTSAALAGCLRPTMSGRRQRLLAVPTRHDRTSAALGGCPDPPWTDVGNVCWLPRPSVARTSPRRSFKHYSHKNRLQLCLAMVENAVHHILCQRWFGKCCSSDCSIKCCSSDCSIKCCSSDCSIKCCSSDCSIKCCSSDCSIKCCSSDGSIKSFQQWQFQKPSGVKNGLYCAADGIHMTVQTIWGKEWAILCGRWYTHDCANISLYI